MIINGSPINTTAINGVGGASFEDWSGLVDPLTTQIYYALEIDDGTLAPVRVPMSSWQATIQNDRASYTQAVVPNAPKWMPEIDARRTGKMYIYRGARFDDGSEKESLLAEAPFSIRTDEGKIKSTITLSGYVKINYSESAKRVLEGIRTKSVTTGLRVRCALDWFLRPGMVAEADGTTFTVSYINYYVTPRDEYMDVGERLQ